MFPMPWQISPPAKNARFAEYRDYTSGKGAFQVVNRRSNNDNVQVNAMLMIKKHANAVTKNEI